MQQQGYKPDRGPHLVAALLCESVLTETDGVKSLIRIIDRIVGTGQGPDAPDAMPPMAWHGILFLAFKADEARGPVPIRITITMPSGLEEPKPVYEGTIHFEGGTRGHNLQAQLRLGLKEAGPYWFNVYVGEYRVARTPLEVIYTVNKGPAQPPRPPA